MPLIAICSQKAALLLDLSSSYPKTILQPLNSISIMAASDETLTRCTEPKKGGWVTVPFIIGAKVAVCAAVYGLLSNLTVYLIQQFNIPSINATQISSVTSGVSSLAPVIGAIIADAGLGCFNVICGATAASFLGLLLFMVISAVPSLRPPPCSPEMCQAPTVWHLAVLYTATALILAGLGGTRFISATFCASQLDSISEQATLFNWYAMALYGSALAGLTVVVYVQVGLSWTWGFTLCAVLCALGLVVFLLGAPFYRHPEPQKNPFLTMLRATVQIVGRRKKMESPDTHDYYERLDDGSANESEVPISCPSSGDSIAQIKEKEIPKDDFSPLVGLIPVMSTSILLYISVSMVASLTILQALVMDRKLGPNFTIPASSMTVFTIITSILFVPLLAHVVYPIWHRLAHKQLTFLQRIGLAHLADVLALVTAALIELKRREALSGSTEAMSVLWLVPGLVLLGLGEALHFPSQLAFLYQELPNSLTNLATGVIALLFSIAFFMTTAVIALVRRITPWLQDDTNRSRLDNVYWMLTVVGTLNFCYFLICAKLYKTRAIEV